MDDFFDKWANMSEAERKSLMHRSQCARVATKEPPKLERFFPRPRRVRKTSRELRLKNEYGLTTDQWEKMFIIQGRCCAICKSPEPGTVNGWHTDHCHRSKRVRAILCYHCNVLLGLAKDDILRLKRAIAYLRRHSRAID